ncbi:MAG: pantoate--beta-alanine ligase [Gammaproteobacteria bacterium]|mgnify:CR=1 FL=1|jgi:pantoate--beta-alanine ligase|nr:pantoate--beta-alanine ligase [Gammaproteobacteria bacterium]|tara:strand:- start:953 stop:1726 length:774 start_codon:yes stop_codon:yes gene_type:complete
MRIIKTVREYLNGRDGINKGSTGFVPTMGALHRGHQSLIESSTSDCDATVVSIYVNPTQFNSANDLGNYPDTLDQDINLLESLGVDFLFLPSYDDIYPDRYRYTIEESEFSRQLCGSHREGHFTGVMTVVMKLLNIVRPTAAYFGEKDFQQFQLIREMVEAFFMDVKIVPCPTVRETDGLALSSRNLNLDAGSRKKAPLIHELMANDVTDGQISEQLGEAGFDVDYVETHSGRRYVAATIGNDNKQVRLIDNVAVGG